MGVGGGEAVNPQLLLVHTTNTQPIQTRVHTIHYKAHPPDNLFGITVVLGSKIAGSMVFWLEEVTQLGH